MAHRIKVTGFIEIEDHEYDSGDLGPLTEKAWVERMAGGLSTLSDVEFKDVLAEAKAMRKAADDVFDTDMPAEFAHWIRDQADQIERGDES